MQDGTPARDQGIDAIRTATVELLSVCSDLDLRVRQTVQCAHGC